MCSQITQMHSYWQLNILKKCYFLFLSNVQVKGTEQPTHKSIMRWAFTWGWPWLCAPHFLLPQAGRVSPRLSVCQTDIPPFASDLGFQHQLLGFLVPRKPVYASEELGRPWVRGLGSCWELPCPAGSLVLLLPEPPFPGLTSPAVKLLLNYIPWSLSFFSKTQIMVKTFCSPPCPHLLPLSLLVQSPKFSPWCSERTWAFILFLLSYFASRGMWDS